ncbi:MAG: glycoside hydrolase family 3 protein, partial [Legionellales bacterium]|nr:glycoside hydrolase family 3 protein [Legionellales bacterium]
MYSLNKKLLLFSLLLLASNIYAATLDEMIGQMLIIGFKEDNIIKDSALLEDIKNKRIGGVILFDIDYQKVIQEASNKKISVLNFRKSLKQDQEAFKKVSKNIKNPKQLKSLIADLKKYSQKFSSVPLIIAIDREGGIVDRLAIAKGFPKTISQKEFASLSEKEARNVAKEYANTMEMYGFNYVFAPVVDLEVNIDNPVISKLERAFSDNPKIVTKYANFIISA